MSFDPTLPLILFLTIFDHSWLVAAIFTGFSLEFWQACALSENDRVFRVETSKRVVLGTSCSV
jgi:hypothetical protein